MADATALPDFNDSIARHARVDQPLLKADMTVEKALAAIRREGLGERIIYFYAVDEHDRLAGVLPTRRLLTASPEITLRELMVTRVVAIPSTATVLDACEFFVLYKFFAFPVVDADRHIIGVVDISLFTAEILEEKFRRAYRAFYSRPDVLRGLVRSLAAEPRFLLRFATYVRVGLRDWFLTPAARDGAVAASSQPA